MSDKDQIPQADTEAHIDTVEKDDLSTHDPQMTTSGQILDSAEITDTDSLTYDWETSETLHIVKTFPISDYGTKSDAGQTSSEFDVPDPSISGIADSTTIESSSKSTTDVEEKYVEVDLLSLSDISDVKVSNATRKHEYAKARIEREGNTFDKLYNACLKGQRGIVKCILENHETRPLSGEDGQTPLYAACIGNHLEIINLLIESGYDINHQDNEGKTPLHITFEHYEVDLAETLITKFHADTEIRDKNYWTPLHTAIDRGFYSYSEQLSEKFLQQDVDSEVRWIQLHAACVQENTQNVQTLLDAETDVNHASSAGHTPLHIAVSKNCIDIITLLLDQRADVNGINSCHETPLHIAVDKGEEPIIQKLLSWKADPSLKDAVGNTSLHLAVKKEEAKPGFIKAGASVNISDWSPFPSCYSSCNIQLVQAIIDHGAHVNVMNNRRQTALWFACCSGQVEFVKILLNAGADPNIADKNGESCLHAAVYGSCNAETIQNLIDHGASVNAVNGDGATALLLACGSAKSATVDVLLKAKADPNLPDTDGDASLHAATAANCSKETLQEIIKYGGNVNAVNKRGRTALLLNCSYGQMDSVQVLLGAGADPNITDEIGYSCIFAAVDGRCSKDTLQTLIDHGANIDTKRKDGTNALLCACRTGQSESVKFLLEEGANVNVTKPDGNTCLHVAVKGNCNKEALQKCIENGTSINAMNNEGKTALIFACESAQTGSVALLLKEGGDPNISDAYGFTSLHSAVVACCTNETLHEIINHQVNIDAQNNNGRTALWIACIFRQQETVKILLKAGSNSNIADHEGHTSLSAAVFGNCSKNIIRTMIKHGANVNATNKESVTALMLASKEGNVDAMNILINAGADQTFEDDDGNTWINYAIHGDCKKEVFQSIIDLGTDVNAMNKFNVTALMMACEKGNVDAINVLINAGANMAIKDADGDTWIHYAIYGDCEKEVLQSITDLGADVNATNNENVTALMMACEKGNVDAINVLINAGADKTIKDAGGNTWIHHMLLGNCKKEVLQAVFDLGPDFNAIYDSFTVCMLAIRKRNTESDAMDGLMNVGAKMDSKKFVNTWIHCAIDLDCKKEVLQSIIDLGADVNAANNKNVTDLMLASEKGNVDAINVLINAGANMSIKNVVGNTWIHYAIYGDGKKEVLQSITDLGADVNATNNQNITALMLASKKGNVDAINVLINAGANMAIKDADGDTWIHYAIYGDCEKEVLQSITDLGADVNATNNENVTALMMACEKGNVDAINVLIYAGADKTIKDAGGNTWIHHMLLGNCKKEVLQAVFDLGPDFNAIYDSFTVCMLAIRKRNTESDAMDGLMNVGAKMDSKKFVNTWIHCAIDLDCKKEVLQSIIDLGADVNAANNKNVTALMLASKKGNVDAMNVLINAGANMAIKDADGDTWIHYAIYGDCEKEVLQSITDLGADVNATNNENVTALMLASKKGNVDAMNVLINAGANMAIKDADGDTWIHYAIYGDCEKEVLQSITDLGVDVNAANNKNVTALMLASKKGNVDAMNVLINEGANITVKDVDGNTWIHYAIHGDCKKEVLQSIIDLGADVNAANNKNVTALMLASKKGNVDAMNVLINAGANMAIKDADGDTWIHYAIYGDCEQEVLQSIIDLGADLNTKNKQRETAFMLASRKGNVDAMIVLMSAGANMAIENDDCKCKCICL